MAPKFGPLTPPGLSISPFPPALPLVGVVAACALAATLPACDERVKAGIAPVKISGKTFYLEEALDPKTRLKGLGERQTIDPDGGMLFVFPSGQVQVHRFIMRDCPIPIDIIYLDGSGRILSWHAMKPEPPRAEGEGTPADLFATDRAGQDRNARYDARLPGYSSKFPAQFAVELKGGTLATLNLKEGDKVEMDVEGLKKRAK
jgi:hypothetical protein